MRVECPDKVLDIDDEVFSPASDRLDAKIQMELDVKFALGTKYSGAFR